jgi:archaellum component FlaC
VFRKIPEEAGGNRDMEDGLNRLNKPTREEARIATAQLLTVAHTVHEGVKGATNQVADVDDRLVGINEKVVDVDSKVEHINDRVAGVDVRVAGIDDKVEVVNDAVAGVGERVKTVDDKVTKVTEDARIHPSLFKSCSTPIN